MSDDVSCEVCRKPGRRRRMQHCPEGWFYGESLDEGTRRPFVLMVCSKECRDAFWLSGPGSLNSSPPYVPLSTTPADEPHVARPDRILGSHARVVTPEPALHPLAEPIAHWPLTIVLLGSPLGDYAAYVGIGSPAWVARQGSKLTFEQARSFFPAVTEERYRD